MPNRWWTTTHSVVDLSALEQRVVVVEVRGIDVAGHRPQTGLQHGRRHRKARVGRDDDLCPGRQRLQRHQRERERRRAGRDQEDVTDAEVSADFLLEPAHRALRSEERGGAVPEVAPVEWSGRRRNRSTNLMNDRLLDIEGIDHDVDASRAGRRRCAGAIGAAELLARDFDRQRVRSRRQAGSRKEGRLKFVLEVPVGADIRDEYAIEIHARDAARRRRSPIHLIDVPEKVNVACAPVVCESFANSPLQKLKRPPVIHVPEYTHAGRVFLSARHGQLREGEHDIERIRP